LKQAVGIIGAGNVGSALGWSLQDKGYPLAGIYCRTRVSSEKAAAFLRTDSFNTPAELASISSTVIVATPDRVIKPVVEEIADENGFGEGQVVLHTSGAHSSEVLHRAGKVGASVMSLHPLQTFPGVEEGVSNLPGSYFTLEGDEKALELGRKMVRDIEGHPLTIDTEMKPVYHAAACVVCNYYITLMDMGKEMMEAAGISREDALPALMPLIEGTLSNVKKVGVPAALTGPVERGDASTLQAHVAAMEENMEHLVETYISLGVHTAAVARRKGSITGEQERKIWKALDRTQGTGEDE